MLKLLFVSKSQIKIALLGCGTVGSGVIKILENLKREDLELTKILVRNNNRAAELSNKLKLNPNIFTTNIDEILNDPSIAIIVEVMGQVESTKAVLLKAIQNKKNIITANKDLLALEGEDLFEAAKANNVTILFEAAVAGGIPIIATLKQSLQANKILRLHGIINGTTNYILDTMKSDGQSFDEALKHAQELGFAESDPTNDVDGHDAAYKIAILASIISGKRVNVNDVYREGIRNITSADIKSAEKRNYEIKLLGIIDNSGEELDVRVHPVFVSKHNPLASVRRENNAIFINGDALPELTLIGKGAGSLPTASSVVGDILMLASQLASSSNPHPQYICQHQGYAKIKNIKNVINSFYVRVSMHDKVGVLKDLGSITAKHGANVKFIDQYETKGSEAHADFIIDPIKEESMQKLLGDIKSLDSIKTIESVIRIDLS